MIVFITVKFSTWNAKSHELIPTSWLCRKHVQCTEGGIKIWFYVITYCSEPYWQCFYQQWIFLAEAACPRHTHQACVHRALRLSEDLVSTLYEGCSQGALVHTISIPLWKKNFRHISITLKSVVYHFSYRDSVNTRNTPAAQSCPCRHTLYAICDRFMARNKESQIGEEIQISVNNHH